MTIDSPLRTAVCGMALLATASPLAAEVAAAPAVGVTLAHAMKLIGGMVAVLLVIAGCAWAARQLPIVRSQRNGALRILESVSVGNRERMLLVDVEGTRLLIGVGSAGMSCLHVLGTSDPISFTADFGTRLQESLQARGNDVAAATGGGA